MYKVGDFVIFGRPYGEKTFGRILKVNAASYLTASLEKRNGDRVGVVYRVQKTMWPKCRYRIGDSILMDPASARMPETPSDP